MTLRLAPMAAPETTPARTEDDGLGAMQTERGNLPLESVDAAVRITGLVATTVLTQGFTNPHDVPLEATYIFPLPDRAAVTAMRMTADDRVVDAELKERGQAREEYDRAIAEGKRASIAEEERPDVFTMRVGNILPGERVSVSLTLVGPLPFEDGEATYRLPLVVAPRYIPGRPMDGPAVGDGYALDTDAVPDASRITPPVLLPGFPNPVRLSIGVDVDPAGLPLGEVRSSLHAVVQEGNHLAIEPGERANRDFILRLEYGQAEETTTSLRLVPDGDEGTFRLTVLPPTTSVPARPRDVVLLLDRSGSMQGWKMVAARRAAARIVDTLTDADRFAVLTFDHVVEHPTTLAEGLVQGTDRHRYRAVEHLSRVESRGGTELLEPMRRALALLTDRARDRVLVLVTDGQVGNEDQILGNTAKALAGVRIHTVGIDRAVNAGFLGRLAVAGGGRCELVESEDRLDAAMDSIHRRIGAPLVRELALRPEGMTLVDDTVAPHRMPDLFPGVPLVITGRYTGATDAAGLELSGRTRDGQTWSAAAPAVPTADAALAPVWARAHLRDLEDRYASMDAWTGGGREALEQRITKTSLRFGVLCRFTAWLAVDSRVVTEGGETRRVIQPVEPADGWAMLADAAPPAPMMMMAAASMPMPTGAAGGAMARGIRVAGRAMRPAAAPKRSRVPGLREERVAPPAIAIGEQIAAELRGLEAAQDAPEYERRELLADLGTRLAALLSGAGAIDEGLRRLAEELANDRPLTVPTDEFERLWAQTLAVLGAAPAAPARKAFWKKG